MPSVSSARLPRVRCTASIDKPSTVGMGLDRVARRALVLLLAVSLVAKFIWAGLIGVCNDEAYHYLFTVYPNWSYFDHPPMTMLVAKAGILLCGGWVHPFSLRLGFCLLFIASSWVMFRWTARWYGEWAGVWAALLLNLSGYYGLAGGFALPDGPFLFFALLTMWALSEALVAQPGRTRPWVWVGLAFAGALLSKYHAVFLPAGAGLYILLTPGSRHLLRRPGPYLALAIGLAGFLPVIMWNAEHNWASFRFQGGRALGGGFDPSGLVGALLGPVICLLPWIWWPLATALGQGIRHFRSSSENERLILCLAIVPLAFFIAIGCMRWLLLHWALIAFVPLYPLAGTKFARWAEVKPERARRFVMMVAGVLFAGGSIAFIQAELGVIPVAEQDAFTEARGWELVAGELSARGLVSDPNIFLFTGSWYTSGQLAFALRNRSPVLCYSGTDARGFAFWSKPEEWVGKSGLFVALHDDPRELATMAIFFRRMELVAEFPMIPDLAASKIVRVYRCFEQIVAFPFACYGKTR